jgi:hypothetical protein
MRFYNDIINKTVVIRENTEIRSRHKTGSQSAVGTPLLQVANLAVSGPMDHM